MNSARLLEPNEGMLYSASLGPIHAVGLPARLLR